MAGSTDYRPRIERALHYIRDHLDETLTVADVARAAHLSEFHFHRIFTMVMGEPVGRFVTRKRLELAAMRIAYEPERSITDIALSSGYSSPSNFTKAFVAHFGCTPSDVRRGAKTPGKLDPASLYVLPPEADESTRDAEHARLSAIARFENWQESELACIASTAGYSLAAVEHAWSLILAAAHEAGLQQPFDAYGLAFDSPQLLAKERCHYHACLAWPADKPIPSRLFRGKIPAGRYAIFPYSGPVADAEAHYRAIYSAWLPRSSAQPDDFVAVDHYVQGGPTENPSLVGKTIRFEVCVKLRV